MNTAGKSLINKWSPLLKNTMGAPVKSQGQAMVLSTLFENQAKLNNGFLPESANVTSDVAVYQQYALPLIRRQFPELLAMNTVAVIPMTTPVGVYFAMRYLYDYSAKKKSAFRYGEKKEIGYDLDRDYTGKGPGAWSTSEGEYLSNFMESNDPDSADAPHHELHTYAGPEAWGANPPELGGHRIKTASIKVIRGTAMAQTRAIKSQYTLELQQDMAALHGQDVEANLLEALQFEIQQEIDREILEDMKWVSTRPGLGGEAPIAVNLEMRSEGPSDGRWAGERIAGGVVNTILALSQKVAVTTRMGAGNFAIVSPAILAAITTLNNGLYQPSGYLGTAVNGYAEGCITEVGTLNAGMIKVYRDVYAEEDYALVGYKGARMGEAGIIFMPYIPYIFTKTAGQEDGSPRLIVKSRYAVVANLLGAGQFYRMVVFTNSDKVIAYGSTANPWEASGISYGDASFNPAETKGVTGNVNVGQPKIGGVDKDTNTWQPSVEGDTDADLEV